MCDHFETKALQAGVIQAIAEEVTKAAYLKTRSTNVKQESLFNALAEKGLKNDFMHIGDCKECFRKLTAVFTAKTRLNDYHKMLHRQMEREFKRDTVEAA